MQVTVEVLNGLQRRMIVQVPFEEVEKLAEKRLIKLSKKVKVDGFRPGKVPMRILKKLYLESARNEVLPEVMRDNIYKAFQQEDINPAGMPNVDVGKFKENEPIEIIANFEVYPEINLVELQDSEIEQYSTDITPDDVEKSLSNLQQQHAEHRVVERSAKNGDMVNIDFEGFMGGKSFKGGKGKGVSLVLGSQQMIVGFEEAIVDSRKGDELEVELKFPEDYKNKELAGKPVTFVIKVNGVTEYSLPSIDDEFCKKFGIMEGGVCEFQRYLKEYMQKELKSNLKFLNKMRVFNSLLEKNDVALPKALVDSDIKQLKEQSLKKMGEEKSKLPDIPDALFEAQAKRRVQLGLLIMKVIEKYDLKVDDKKTDELLNEMAEDHDNPKQMKEWYHNNKSAFKELQQTALENEVVQLLLNGATIVSKKLTYDEVIQEIRKF